MRRLLKPASLLLAAAAFLTLLTAAAHAQQKAFRTLEGEFLKNKARYLRLRCLDDHKNLEHLSQRLRAEVDEDLLTGDDRIDFLCLSHLIRTALAEYRIFDREHSDPGVILPYGSLFDRAVAAPRSQGETPVQRLFNQLLTLAVRLETSPARWTALRKELIAPARKRAKNLRSQIDGELALLLKHLPPDRSDALEKLRTRILGLLQEWDAALAKKAGILPAPAPDEQNRWNKRRLDFTLRYRYLVDYDSDELMRRGAQFFLDTTRELEAQARAIDPDRSWQDLARKIEKHHPGEGNIVPFAENAMRKAMRFVEEKGLVTLPPGTRKIDVVPGKPNGPSPYAHYRPARGKRKAAYVAVPCAKSWSRERRQEHLAGNSRSWLQVVAIHEAVPGHHLQFTVARSIRSPIRRLIRPTTYVEGWALYTEEMMGRQGFYDGPTRLTQLRMKLWRSARVLLSVGFNHRGLTEDGAVRFLTEKILAQKPHAKKEAKNYRRRPHYFVAYAIGFWQIEALRRDMEKHWGADYSLRRFHDTLLAFGPLPLPLIRKALEADVFPTVRGA